MPEAVLNAMGSPTPWEARNHDLHPHGSRTVPEALPCVSGKPGRAGGPVIKYDSTYGSRSMPEAMLYAHGKPDTAGVLL